VIVRQDDRSGVRQQRSLEDLTRMEQRSVERASAHLVIGDHSTLGGEAQNCEYLARLVLQQRCKRSGRRGWSAERASGAEVILLAGSRYREGVDLFLRQHGFSVSIPMEGLGIGKQLQWLNRAVHPIDAR
jgi:hypothetical protein